MPPLADGLRIKQLHSPIPDSQVAYWSLIGEIINLLSAASMLLEGNYFLILV
jgi:hypothetical protein